eukprot:g22579.t1
MSDASSLGLQVCATEALRGELAQLQEALGKELRRQKGLVRREEMLLKRQKQLKARQSPSRPTVAYLPHLFSSHFFSCYFLDTSFLTCIL